MGQTLTADTSGIADANGLNSASYRGTWYANNPNEHSSGGFIRKSNTPGDDLDYKVSRRDVGKTLKIWVYFTDDAGNSERIISAKTAVVTATTPAAPNRFHADPEPSRFGGVSVFWTVPTWRLAYEARLEQGWGDGGSPITGYVVQWKETSGSWDVEADVSEATVTGTVYRILGLTGGTRYTARVRAVNSIGRGTPSIERDFTGNTPATGAPVINGTAEVGQTLTVDTSGIADEEGLNNVSYYGSWYAYDPGGDLYGTYRHTNLFGEELTYTVSSLDVGKTLKIRLNFTDDVGNSERLFSAETDVVRAANTPATGAPVISGRAREGRTLTASTSGIADADGLTDVSYSYHWLADDTDISGATSSTYTVLSSDIDKVIKVRVTFIDDAGNDESLTSAGTSAVITAANITATGAPAISGRARVGHALTASTSGIADADGLTNVSYSYQWLADDTDISGATSSTYIVQSSDIDKVIKVRVTFTDDEGNDESLTSEGTLAVVLVGGL